MEKEKLQQLYEALLSLKYITERTLQDSKRTCEQVKRINEAMTGYISEIKLALNE